MDKFRIQIYNASWKFFKKSQHKMQLLVKYLISKVNKQLYKNFKNE